MQMGKQNLSQTSTPDGLLSVVILVALAGAVFLGLWRNNSQSPH
jgi:hypothetical protein